MDRGDEPMTRTRAGSPRLLEKSKSMASKNLTTEDQPVCLSSPTIHYMYLGSYLSFSIEITPNLYPCIRRYFYRLFNASWQVEAR
jgi:hypothetical protein